MTDVAISVEGLSKRYRIGARQVADDNLVSTIGHFIARPARNLRRLRRLSRFNEDGQDPSDVIWALKDVSFQVGRGEVMGIIGANGAGKSTLLKILSRITEPTTGRALVRGRVSSLLEVGTGFHPELTGRDNVYLNGSVLGLKKKEIDRKFDEIVSFSEVEQFIDTPVKRYSTGMRLRLAFAVAAHLDPEILLIDEVLAVGDIAFQRKSLGKMEGITQQGRTVLFVSHNLAAVGSLCHRAMVLERGRIAFMGDVQEALGYYTTSMEVDSDPEEFSGNGASTQRGGVRVLNLRFGASVEPVVRPGDSVTASFTLELNEPFWDVQVLLILRDADHRLIIRDEIARRDLPQLSGPGVFRVNINIPALWLSGGLYTCYVKVVAEALNKTDGCVSNPVPVRIVEPEGRSYAQAVLLSPRTVWDVVPD